MGPAPVNSQGPAGCRADVLRVHAGLSAALRAAMPDRQTWPTICYKPGGCSECRAARGHVHSWLHPNEPAAAARISRHCSSIREVHILKRSCMLPQCADVYTILGIYYACDSNPWRIKPTLYSKKL
jgi:hypothetical protein